MFDLLQSALFDADGAPAGGGAPAGDVTPPAGDQGQDGQASTPTGGEQPGKGQDVITMTPAQLSERLTRARGTERTELAKSLGFDSVDALQSAIKAGQDALKAQMSDQERQAAELKAAQDKAAALEAQLGQEKSAATKALIQAEALAQMAGRFANPKTAFRLLDLSGVAQQADGSFKGLNDAIEQLAKDEPWTLSGDGKKPVVPKIGATNPEGGDRPAKESDDEKRARYFGGKASAGFFEGGGVKATVEKK